ncbi:MAG: NAD(+) kinase [Gammaproteobacteria bacterium]|nr:NAD(+) kinase [Gammaproteobacteria bacterium]MCZ6854176.1 NAD(+) kinase [Gammaproteobacteria bacterium]
MTSSFSTVGLIGRQGNPQILESVVAVEQCLVKHGVDLVVEDSTASMLNGTDHEVLTRLELGERCDLIVVVGGDGSLLGVGRDLAHAQVPVLGVNRGGLGFLANISPGQIETKIAEVLAGEFTIEDHFLLEARIWRGEREVGNSPALNDVVVHLGGMARMMEFSLWVDDQFVYDQRSDGVIVASPTGSTAYSLSAGGPIMHPGLDAIVIVPMFPHTLTSRPLVVSGQAQIKVVVGEIDSGYTPQISCDSQVEQPLEAGDEVRICKYTQPLRLLYPLGHSFFESCRSKLDWASRLGDR